MKWALLHLIIAFVYCSCQWEKETSGQYMFYLPGGIVLEQGEQAISPYFGTYHYREILDTLRSYGFQVISFVKPGAPDSAYVNRISRQIDSLLATGVPPESITVVGASAGAYITLDISIRLANTKINYAILGMCRSETYKVYQNKELCGRFLSFYEVSDPHGSCTKIFEVARCVTSFREIELQLNTSHAFLYRPHKEWVHPLVAWASGKESGH